MPLTVEETFHESFPFDLWNHRINTIIPFLGGQGGESLALPVSITTMIRFREVMTGSCFNFRFGLSFNFILTLWNISVELSISQTQQDGLELASRLRVAHLRVAVIDSVMMDDLDI